MDSQTPALSNEIELLKRAYAALNRNDIDGFAKDLDPEIERVEFEGSAMAGTFRGIDAVKAHVARGRGTWAEGTCTPEQFVVAGDKVILRVKVHVRLKDKADWITGETGDAWTFRNGKAIGFRTFFAFDEALAWAGVS